jgi:peptide deformylase
VGLKLTNDLKVLHQPCKPTTVKQGSIIGRNLLKFIDQFNRQSLKTKAVGLAAPQVGIDARVCVISLPHRRRVLINPVITEHSLDKFVNEEGCLSLPGVKVNVVRWRWVRVACDNWAEPESFGINVSNINPLSYEDLLFESAVVQHEIMHLDGVLIDSIAM